MTIKARNIIRCILMADEEIKDAEGELKEKNETPKKPGDGLIDPEQVWYVQPCPFILQ